MESAYTHSPAFAEVKARIGAEFSLTPEQAAALPGTTEAELCVAAERVFRTATANRIYAQTQHVGASDPFSVAANFAKGGGIPGMSPEGD